MRRSLVVGAVVLVASLVVWQFFQRTSDSHNNAAGQSLEAMHDRSGAIQLKGKTNTVVSIASSASAQDAADRLQKSRQCLESQRSASEVAEEIASLKTAMSQVAEDLRPALALEIQKKEESLTSYSQCPSRVSSADVARLLEAAARAGDLRAKLQYAEDPMIDPLHAVAELDALRRWHGTALAYIDDGISARDTHAAILRAGAADPYHCRAANEVQCSGMLSHLVAQDPKQAYSYYLLSTLFGGEPEWVRTEMSALKKLLSPDEIAWAEDRANTLASK